MIRMTVRDKNQIGFGDFLVLIWALWVPFEPWVEHDALSTRRGNYESTVSEPLNRELTV